MKKIGWIISIIIISVMMGCFIVLHTNNEKKEKELQWLYERQNRAFDLSTIEESVRYHGREEMNMQYVAVSLYAYSLENPEKIISLHEVEEYFSKEYSEDGSLMVYSCPDSIKDYIDWWWNGGQSKIFHFYTEVVVYLSEKGYDYNIDNYTVEELQDIFPNVR